MNGKRYAFILCLPFALGVSAQVSGDLDSTFSAEGIVNTDITPMSNDHGTCMALQPDGRMVVAGNSLANGGNGYTVAVARYMPDGSLDNSFGTNGTVTTAVGPMDDGAHAVAVQPDGKILVGGASFDNGLGYLFLMVRYNADGTLDNSFSGDGWRTDNIGAGSEDRILSIAVQADGKIIAAGRAGNGTDQDIALARYNADGSLDNSFSGDGLLVAPVGPGNDEAIGVAVQPDGRILIAGYSGNGTDDHITLERFNADGTLDGTFGNGGGVTTSYGPEIDWAYALALQPDGRILAARGVMNGLQLNFAVLRYEANGILDNTFSSDGITVNTFSALCIARSLALLPDGRIVAGGTSGSSTMLAVYNADGTPDNNFSGDGVQSHLEGANNYGNAVAVQADGRIVQAGTANFPNTLDDFLLLRYLNDLNIGVL